MIMEDKRKKYTIDKFIQLVTSPVEKIMLPLILAGHNKMELNSKSEQELRQMILDYVTVNQEDFFKAMSSSNPEVALGLKKAILLLGMSTEELYSKLGFNVEITKKESEKNIEAINESEQYLYHTEELFEMALQEFLVSELSNQERVLKYISRIEQIEKGFRKYAVNTVGFVGSERYKQVYEYLKTIPRITPFIEDETKGNGINMIMAKKYYDDIAVKLGTSFSESDTPKKL